MRKFMVLVALAFALITVIPTGHSSAKDSYTLRFTTDKAKYTYLLDQKGTLNLMMENVPLPGASVDIRNVEMHSLTDEYTEVINYDSGSDQIEMKISKDIGLLRLGYDYFQLPPLEQFLPKLFEQMGQEIPGLQDSVQEKAEITVKMSPRGKLTGFNMELPPEAQQQAGMAMGMISNYIQMMFEPSFPEKPVSVGESWKQNFYFDKVPVIGLPNLVVTYTLEGVEKDEKGHNVARISARARWHYDMALLEKQVVGQTFEYYEGKEFEVVSLKPAVDIKIEAMFKFNIDGGYTISSASETEFIMSAKAGLKKNTGRNRNEIWSPKITYAIYSVDTSQLKEKTNK